MQSLAGRWWRGTVEKGHSCCSTGHIDEGSELDLGRGIDRNWRISESASFLVVDEDGALALQAHEEAHRVPGLQVLRFPRALSLSASGKGSAPVASNPGAWYTSSSLRESGKCKRRRQRDADTKATNPTGGHRFDSKHKVPADTRNFLEWLIPKHCKKVCLFPSGNRR